MLDNQFDKMYRDGKIPTRRPGGERMWNMDETQIADGAHLHIPRISSHSGALCPNPRAGLTASRQAAGPDVQHLP